MENSTFYQIIKVSFIVIVLCLFMIALLLFLTFFYDFNSDLAPHIINNKTFTLILSTATVALLFLNYMHQRMEFKRILKENRESTDLQIILAVRANLIEVFSSENYEFDKAKMTIEEFAIRYKEKLIDPYARLRDDEHRKEIKNSDFDNVDNDVIQSLKEFNLDSIRRFAFAVKNLDRDLMVVIHKKNNGLIDGIIPFYLKYLFTSIYKFNDKRTLQSWEHKIDWEDKENMSKVFHIRQIVWSTYMIKKKYYEKYESIS